MQVTSGFEWPAGFARVPDEPWATAPVDAFAQDYDRLQHDSWYANLGPTVKAVAPWLDHGACVVDYSGGTGILLQRLLAERPEANAGLVNVDASAKFLRQSMATLGSEPRCAFRHLPFLRAEGRLRSLAEAIGPLVGNVDGIVCANAFHLYPDPADVSRAWFGALRPGGWLHVQSGNLIHEAVGAWIIDDTVTAIQQEARRRVASDPAFASHRAAATDPERRTAYDSVCSRYFPAPRPLEAALEALESAGFVIDSVHHRRIHVKTAEWARFLGVYHEGILPWVGGCRDVDGRPPDEVAVRERLDLIRDCLSSVVGGPTFEASWTYVDAHRPE